VTRQIEQTHTLEIEADDADEAIEKAEDEILNIDDDDWDDGAVLQDAEVDVDKVEEMADEDAED
jgi:hypothetical protein